MKNWRTVLFWAGAIIMIGTGLAYALGFLPESWDKSTIERIRP